MNKKIEEIKDRTEKIRRCLGEISPRLCGELYSIIDYLIAECERLEKENGKLEEVISNLNIQGSN